MALLVTRIKENAPFNRRSIYCFYLIESYSAGVFEYARNLLLQ